ncbi:hypothetical protein [Ensifer sp. 1H6]|uniref:hypothetical protein n=1 Tax=Ensifer sp. 1H6 TaxID=1911585 RepID=UPI001FD8EB67|nr:hypothetical protein [Ensifer sp. 1H6]
MIVKLDDDIAEPAQAARRLPFVAEARSHVDEALVDALTRPTVIEADGDGTVAVTVDEALYAIARDLVADRWLGDKIVFLAVHKDVGLQTVAPAARQNEDMGVQFVAFVPLGIKDAVALRFSGAIERARRHVSSHLHLTLNGGELLLVLLALLDLGEGELRAKGQCAADDFANQGRAE